MSFIRNYMEYVKRDEAHPHYHLWSCLVVVASLVGRKVWVQRPYARIYGNLYVILVGPQGNRKTAAKDLAQGFMRDVGGISFATEATTRESLIDQMKKQEDSFMVKGAMETYCSMTICATEFKEFVAKDPIGIINFMTAIFDRDFYDYGTLKRGVDIIYNPYLNMIACETPEWLTDRLKERVVSGGFSRRVNYVYETTHARNVDTQLLPECIAAKNWCLKDAQRIRNLAGEITLSDECRKFYDKWYLELKMPADPALVGFYESKHTLALKIAALICMSEGNTLVMEQPHFELALNFIGDIEKKMGRVFAGGGRNELGTVSMKIMDLLDREKKPVSEKLIFVALFQDCRDMREMESVIAHLVRSEKVIRYHQGNSVAAYLCSRQYLPASVQKALERATGSSSDSSASSNPPPEPSATPEGAFDLLQELQPNAPSASEPPAAPAPLAPGDSADTSQK